MLTKKQNHEAEMKDHMLIPVTNKKLHLLKAEYSSNRKENVDETQEIGCRLKMPERKEIHNSKLHFFFWNTCLRNNGDSSFVDFNERTELFLLLSVME